MNSTSGSKSPRGLVFVAQLPDITLIRRAFGGRLARELDAALVDALRRYAPDGTVSPAGRLGAHALITSEAEALADVRQGVSDIFADISPRLEAGTIAEVEVSLYNAEEELGTLLHERTR